MLRPAGYATRYATVIVYYDTPRLSRWCGFGGNGDYNDLGGYVFYNGGWPDGFGTGTADGWHAVYAPGGQEIWTGIRRVWVEADIGGQWYTLDPAFAECSVTQATNLAPVLSYDRTNLLAAAMQGATTNAAWVRDVNAANLATELTRLATNLLGTLRAEYDTKGIDALVGGRVFSPEAVTNLPSALPYAEDVASASRTTFDHVPAARILSVTVAYQNIVKTFSGHELGGRPLMITHDASASYAPKLWLDGEVMAVGAPTTPGETNTLTWTVDQPYASAGWAADSIEQTLKSTNSYVLVYDFGSASRQRSVQAARKLESLLAAGHSASSETARLYAMHAAAVGGLEQWKLSRAMLGHIADAICYSHHFLGVMGQEEGYYLDLPGLRSQTLPFSGEASDWETLMKADSFFASALEHGVLEQTQGTNRPAASTIKIAFENNAAGHRTFLADSANWSTVRAALTNYSAQTLSELDARMDADSVILLPENGSVSVRQWSGYGFAHFWSQSSGPTWSAAMGMIIGGGYSGGYGGEPGPYSVPATQNLYVNAISPAPQTQIPSTTARDPVDLRTGHLLHQKPALALGSDSPPRGQQLVLSYSSSEAARERQLGRGWRHNLDVQAVEASDGAAAFGLRQASDAAALVAAAYVVADLLDENAGVREWTTAALATKWALDQMNQKTVVVRMGDHGLSYMRMPDGAYNPPPSVTTDLIKTNGLFRLVERFGKEYRFDANGLLSSIVDADGNTMSLAYNAQTNLSTVTDSYSRALTFSYTGGALTQVSDGTGRTVSFGYTGDDLTSVTDPDGGVWEYAYDADHRMTALIDPLDQVTASNVYNSVGQVVTQFNGYGEAWAFYCSGYEGTEVDPQGGATTHRFDADGRNLGTTDALGNRTYNYYDGQGRLASNVNARGFVTVFHYDANHNLTNRLDALGNAWRFEYDAAHHLVAATDPFGNVTRYGYDAGHHLTNTVDALTNSTVLTFYNSGSHKGLAHTVTDPNGNVTTYTYDDYGNAHTIARTDGGTVTNTWNARGDLLVARDASGNATTMTYNKRRLVTSVADALGNTVSNVYNAAGLRTAVVDPLDRQTVTAWTPTYKVASVTYPDSSVVTNIYDSRDLLVATVDPRGGVQSNLFDSAGRKVAATDRLGNTTRFVLDANGYLIAQTNALGKATAFAYDGLNRLIRIVDPLGHSVSNTFDAADRLTHVTDWSSRTTAYTYDDIHRKTGVDYPSSATGTWTWDDASRLTRIQYHNGTSNFVDRVYTLDAHGNTTAMEINAGLLPTVSPMVKRLTQNAADELTAIQTKTNPGVQDWTDKTPVHDDEGNLTSDGDSTYGYDYENRLVSASAATESAFYYYAGDGSRVAAVTVASGSTNTTVFVLDYADPLRRPLAELDGNGALIRRFVWGRGVVAQIAADGTVRYFHHDGQGSTLALTDTNNVPTDQWFYSPYGEVMSRTGTTDTPYQWCGGVGLRHEVGSLYFARHRYYHAGLRAGLHVTASGWAAARICMPMP